MPNFNHLRTLYHFINDRVPTAQLDLDAIVSEIREAEGRPKTSCGSICCGLGWAGSIPDFRKLGLKTSHHGDYGVLTLNGNNFGHNIFMLAAEFFDLSEKEAYSLFDVADDSKYDKLIKAKHDKDRFLARVRILFALYGETV